MRDMFGLLPAHITKPVALISGIVKLSTLFFVTELTLFRFLYIVVWRRMKTIEDNFWDFVLTISTYLVALYFVLTLNLFGGLDMAKIVDVTEFEETRYNIIFYLYLLH